MFLRRFQWLLGVMWFFVGFAILFRETVLPAAVIEKIKPGNEWLIILMSFVFAAWNFSRWYAYSQRKKFANRNPLIASKPKPESSEEFIPEFNFQNQDNGGKPKTSTS